MATRLLQLTDRDAIFSAWRAGVLVNSDMDRWRDYYSAGYEGKCLGDYWADRKDLVELHSRNAYVLVEED